MIKLPLRWITCTNEYNYLNLRICCIHIQKAIAIYLLFTTKHISAIQLRYQAFLLIKYLYVLFPERVIFTWIPVEIYSHFYELLTSTARYATFLSHIAKMRRFCSICIPLVIRVHIKISFKVCFYYRVSVDICSLSVFIIVPFWPKIGCFTTMK